MTTTSLCPGCELEEAFYEVEYGKDIQEAAVKYGVSVHALKKEITRRKKARYVAPAPRFELMVTASLQTSLKEDQIYENSSECCECFSSIMLSLNSDLSDLAKPHSIELVYECIGCRAPHDVKKMQDAALDEAHRVYENVFKTELMIGKITRITHHTKAA